MQPEDRDRLVRMETKIDIVLQTDTDHEARIRSLEKWRYSWPIAALSAFASAVAAIIASLQG